MLYAPSSSYCTIPPQAFQAMRDFAAKYEAADAEGKDKMIEEFSRKFRKYEARKKALEQKEKESGSLSQ